MLLLAQQPPHLYAVSYIIYINTNILKERLLIIRFFAASLKPIKLTFVTDGGEVASTEAAAAKANVNEQSVAATGHPTGSLGFSLNFADETTC